MKTIAIFAALALFVVKVHSCGCGCGAPAPAAFPAFKPAPPACYYKPAPAPLPAPVYRPAPPPAQFCFPPAPPPAPYCLLPPPAPRPFLPLKLKCKPTLDLEALKAKILAKKEALFGYKCDGYAPAPPTCGCY